SIGVSRSSPVPGTSPEPAPEDPLQPPVVQPSQLGYTAPLHPLRPRASDPGAPVAPVTGVTNRLLTRAIRRVEARWRELYGSTSDVADIPRILAASALAADTGDASFIESLTPRPSLRVSLHLVDLLEDELLAVWRKGDTAASQVLQTVGRLRVVRSAIERRFQT